MADIVTPGFSKREATIAASGTTSAAIDIDGLNPCKLFLPATTGTAFTFTVGETESGTFYTLRDAAGAAVAIAKASAADTGFYVLDPVNFAGLPRYLKVVSGSTELAERSIAVYSQRTKTN